MQRGFTGETPTSERSVLYGTYGCIHRYRGHIRTCSPGRLQGHLWVILTIGSCLCGPLRLFSVFVSGLPVLPHTQSKNTPKHRFDPKYAFGPIKFKKQKVRILRSMLRGIAKWHVFSSK